MTTDPRVHTLRLRETGVPTRLLRARLSPDASPEAWEFIESLPDRLVTAWRRPASMPEDWSQVGKGVVWVGNPGTGKTTEAVATLLECYWKWNIRVHFVAFADYVQLRTEQFSLDQDLDQYWRIQERLDKIHTAGVVLFDDIGKEYKTKTGFAESEWDMLLRQRYRDGRPSLVTTNVRLKEWGETYNPSMGSFVYEAFTPIVMNGRDHRRG